MPDCIDNPCKKCKLSYMEPVGEYLSFEYRCRRLQTKKCNYVYGSYYYVGKSLNCESEREIYLTIKERLFGENKDKCGKEGKYFVSKEI